MAKQTAVFEPLTERVDRLARELELAIRWNRPSILPVGGIQFEVRDE